MKYDMTDELMGILQDEGYYDTHCLAMTKEGLHSKMDIIGQLAKRDREISVLKEQFELSDSALKEIDTAQIAEYEDHSDHWNIIMSILDKYEEKLVELYRAKGVKEPF